MDRSLSARQSTSDNSLRLLAKASHGTQRTGPLAALCAAALTIGAMSLPAAAQTAASFVYTIAGDGVAGYSGDGGPAITADINGPRKAILDGAGDLYIADAGNNRIRKVPAGTGIITTIAGTGIAGWSGDNGPAASAQLNDPGGLALDSAGNLYIADTGNSRIRKIAAGTGIITTIAGTGIAGWSGDKGPAASAQLNNPASVAFDLAGNLYITDSENDRIRKVAAGTGIISTVAGTGSPICNSGPPIGDGGPATSAPICDPQGIAIDAAGNLYFADTFSSNVIRKVTASTGIITTVAGNGTLGYSGDGVPATSAELDFPYDVALDSANNLYIVEALSSTIRKVTASNGTISTIAGNGQICSLFGDGSPAADAGFCYPTGISIDNSGNLYVADDYQRIRLVTAPGPSPTSQTAAPVFSVKAGTYAVPQTVTVTDATPGASIYATLGSSESLNSVPSGIYGAPIEVTGSVTIYATAVAPGYLPSPQVSSAYTITQPPATVINTVAGNGVNGFSGAGGPATSAEFGFLGGLAFDGSGNLYFADTTNNVVWSVGEKTGAISIVAGNGQQGNSGYGGPATSAELNLNGGSAIALDSAGNLYISEESTHLVSKVAASTGIITRYAGNGLLPPCCQSGIGGNGGPATSAELYYPEGLAVDSAGNLYIADSGSEEVLKVTASTGIITTVAGNGAGAYSGDGGPATSANLSDPSSLAIDNAGDLLIGDGFGRVRKVAASTGIITTVAGNGDYGYSGDGGLATGAEISSNGIAVDSTNNLYIANFSAVRMVSASTGIITTVAGGDFEGYSGDGGSATVAELSDPKGIAIDKAGNIYIADSGNYRVREVSPPAATPTFSPVAGTYTSAQTVTISDTSPNASIYYTTNGTTPTTSSSVYSGAISVSSTETLEAIATAGGFAQSATASASYTINLPPPTITVAGTAVTVTPGATTGNTSTITVTPAGGFTGSVALTAAVTTSPAGAQDAPTLSFGTTTPVSITGATADAATLTISTTAAVSGCSSSNEMQKKLPWFAAGGSVLAFAFLFGIPTRRRSWRTMLGMLALLIAFGGGVLACGGGGGGGGGCTTPNNPGTTAGAYTITVTGTSGTLTETGTVTLTVQ